jgi:hypothetical protein
LRGKRLNNWLEELRLRLNDLSQKVAGLTLLNVAAGTHLLSGRSTIYFLNLIDRFTPTHLQVLRYFPPADQATLTRFRAQQDLSNQAVRVTSTTAASSTTRLLTWRETGKAMISALDCQLWT